MVEDLVISLVESLVSVLGVTFPTELSPGIPPNKLGLLFLFLTATFLMPIPLSSVELGTDGCGTVSVNLGLGSAWLGLSLPG